MVLEEPEPNIDRRTSQPRAGPGSVRKKKNDEDEERNHSTNIQSHFSSTLVLQRNLVQDLCTSCFLCHQSL